MGNNRTDIVLYGMPPTFEPDDGTFRPLQTGKTIITTTTFPPGGIQDPEITAVHQVYAALANLSPEARARVVKYVTDRLDAEQK